MQTKSKYIMLIKRKLIRKKLTLKINKSPKSIISNLIKQFNNKTKANDMEYFSYF